MQKKAVLTAVGKDRPGIVAAVTGMLYKLGCNLEGTSMTLLQGEFAMILILSFPESTGINQLKDMVRALEEELGLLFSFKELDPGEMRHGDPVRGKPYSLNVIGADHPGIVHRIASYLAQTGINITDVNTQLVGEKRKSPVYIMVLELDIPSDLKISGFSNELKVLAKDLKVDIALNPVEVFQG